MEYLTRRQQEWINAGNAQHNVSKISCVNSAEVKARYAEFQVRRAGLDTEQAECQVLIDQAFDAIRLYGVKTEKLNSTEKINKT